jgi:hypothetical protein
VATGILLALVALWVFGHIPQISSKLVELGVGAVKG